MKAILLHHAGGDKYAFKNVQQWLLPEIQSIAVEIPGRSDRFVETLLNDINAITDDIFHQIKNELDEDYFFVGVSMGTLVAYLLCHQLKENNLPLPKHLFLASRLSPEAYLHEPTILGILSEDFWEIVTRYEGIPTALFEHQELREFYEPILRADFEALSKYNNSHQPKVQLPISAHVLVGKNDSRNITLHTAQTWSHHFTKEVLYKKFDGGHFFVYDNENVAKYIKEMICI